VLLASVKVSASNGYSPPVGRTRARTTRAGIQVRMPSPHTIDSSGVPLERIPSASRQNARAQIFGRILQTEYAFGGLNVHHRFDRVLPSGDDLEIRHGIRRNRKQASTGAPSPTMLQQVRAQLRGSVRSNRSSKISMSAAYCGRNQHQSLHASRLQCPDRRVRSASQKCN
jgi:hypothetical protein